MADKIDVSYDAFLQTAPGPHRCACGSGARMRAHYDDHIKQH